MRKVEFLCDNLDATSGFILFFKIKLPDFFVYIEMLEAKECLALQLYLKITLKTTYFGWLQHNIYFISKAQHMVAIKEI